MVTLIKECNVVNHKWPKNGPICFQYFCNYEVINHVAVDKNFTWLIVVRLSIAFCVLLATKFSIWIEYCSSVEWILCVSNVILLQQSSFLIYDRTLLLVFGNSFSRILCCWLVKFLPLNGGISVPHLQKYMSRLVSQNS